MGAAQAVMQAVHGLAEGYQNYQKLDAQMRQGHGGDFGPTMQQPSVRLPAPPDISQIQPPLTAGTRSQLPLPTAAPPSPDMPQAPIAGGMRGRLPLPNPMGPGTGNQGSMNPFFYGYGGS